MERQPGETDEEFARRRSRRIHHELAARAQKADVEARNTKLRADNRRLEALTASAQQVRGGSACCGMYNAKNKKDKHKSKNALIKMIGTLSERPQKLLRALPMSKGKLLFLV